jgi:hypothetical protein
MVLALSLVAVALVAAEEPVTIAPFTCQAKKKGVISCGINGKSAKEKLYIEADTIPEFLIKILRAVMLSVFINFSLFIGELAMLINGPGEATRNSIDGLVNILVGPISVVSFYYPDSLAAMMFFAALWHFLCDKAQTKPTFLLLFPWKKAGRSYATWFESIWILVHHTAMGTVKLGLDWGDLPPCDYPLLLFVFIVGAGLAHVSFGMAAFGIRLPFCSSSSMFILSQLLRIAADLSIIILLSGKGGDNTWKYLMVGDLSWLGIMFILRLLKPKTSSATAVVKSKGKPATVPDIANPGVRTQASFVELIDLCTARTSELISEVTTSAAALAEVENPAATDNHHI